MGIVKFRPKSWAVSSALAGVAASAAFAVGDVLMLAKKATAQDNRLIREEENLHTTAPTLLGVSPARSRAGGLAGAMAAPLHVASAWSIYDALSSGSPGRAARVAGTYAGAMAWAGYIHGTFYPWAEAFGAAADAEPGSPQRAGALAQAARVERSIEIPYLALALTVGATSIETMAVVATGRSRFPRWAAPLVTPLGPMAVIVGAVRILPERPAHVLEGASLSLAMLTANAAAALLPRS